MIPLDQAAVVYGTYVNVLLLLTQVVSPAQFCHSVIHEVLAVTIRTFPANTPIDAIGASWTWNCNADKRLALTHLNSVAKKLIQFECRQEPAATIVQHAQFVQAKVLLCGLPVRKTNWRRQQIAVADELGSLRNGPSPACANGFKNRFAQDYLLRFRQNFTFLKTVCHPTTLLWMVPR
jgi:hypothetical protein